MKVLQTNAGYTLIEMMMVIVIGGLLLSGLSGVVSRSMAAYDRLGVENELTSQAHFAMQRMLSAVRESDRLMLPLVDNPKTAYSESLRNPGVLGLTLGASIDFDEDGFADADNDQDGKVNEDPSGDQNQDLAPGFVGIDDDNDGTVDEQHTQSGGPLNEDDDEDDFANENIWVGYDTDGDGSINEDTKKDVNGDTLPGVAGADDDGDGAIDEGDKNDDDEDGSVDEDWLDTMVFFLSGSQLMERRPNLKPIDGTAFTDYVIAENVSIFSVERLPRPIGARATLLEIELQLTDPSGESVTLETRIRAATGY